MLLKEITESEERYRIEMLNALEFKLSKVNQMISEHKEATGSDFRVKGENHIERDGCSFYWNVGRILCGDKRIAGIGEKSGKVMICDTGYSTVLNPFYSTFCVRSDGQRLKNIEEERVITREDYGDPKMFDSDFGFWEYSSAYLEIMNKSLDSFVPHLRSMKAETETKMSDIDKSLSAWKKL